MRRILLNLSLCTAIVIGGAAVTLSVVLARRTPELVENKTRKITNVAVQRLRETTVDDFFVLTGSLEPWKDVLLSAETSGKIEWQGVEEGDFVKEGQELLKIDQVSTEIRLKQARAEYQLSRRELERTERLRQKGISSDQDLDRAAVDSNVAMASVRTKEVELKSCVVKAPFEGVVDELHQSRDEYASVGSALVSLIIVRKLKMVVGVADQDIPYFSQGDPVKVLVDAYKDKSFEGKIYRIAERAEKSTHTFETEIELENPDRELKPGMIARAVMVRECHRNSISIPVFSIIHGRDTRYVFLEEDGVARRRPITVGFYHGNLAQIAEGLSAGEGLIVAGHRNLRDKDLVRVSEIEQ